MSQVGERVGAVDEDGSGEESTMEIETDTDHDDEEETDDRPIKCPQCPKHIGFKTRRGLNKHIRDVHAEKGFQCPECSKKFSQQSALNRHHLQVHRSERSFPCDFVGCDKAYGDGTSLERHKIIHGEKNHSCPHCVRRFHYKTHLNRHVRRSHPEHGEKYQPLLQAFTNSVKLKKKNSERMESQEVVMEERNLPDGQNLVEKNKLVFDKIPPQTLSTTRQNLMILMSRKHTLKSDSGISKYWIRQSGLTISEHELLTRNVSEDAANFREAVKPRYSNLPATYWTVSTNEKFYFFSGPSSYVTSQKYKLNAQITQLLKSFLSWPTDKLDLKSEMMQVKFKIYSKHEDPNLFSSFLECNNIRLFFEEETTTPSYNKINWPLNLALVEEIPKTPTIYQMIWFWDDLFHLYIGLNPTGEGVIASLHSNPSDRTAAGFFMREHPTLKYSASTVLTCKSDTDVRITEGVGTLAVFLASQAGVKLLHPDGNKYPIRLLNKEILAPLFIHEEHVQLMQLVTLSTLNMKIGIGCVQLNLPDVKERVEFPNLGPGEFLECQGEESEETLEECLSDDEL